jgi:hypothetical protein
MVTKGRIFRKRVRLEFLLLSYQAAAAKTKAAILLVNQTAATKETKILTIKLR